MAESVRVIAYRVDRCGFYHRDQGEPEFGGLAEIVEALTQWVNERPVGETSTFVRPHDDEGSADDSILCSGIEEVGGDTLFEMWERSGGDGAALASIDANARVGDAATDVSIRSGQIPGVPRLFWFIPEVKLLCAIHVRQRSASRTVIQRYVRDFIKYQSPWCVTEEDGERLRILGYAPDSASPPQRLIPSFRVGSSVDARKVDEIRRRRAEILAVLYKGRVDVGNARTHLRGISGLLTKVTRLSGPLNDARPFRLHIELPYTPSAAELQGLIEEAAEHGTDAGPDVGFRISPERTVLWLKAPNTRLIGQVDATYRNRAQLELHPLLAQLRRRFRAKLIAAAGEEE
jgi:hypothetical protein